MAFDEKSLIWFNGEFRPWSGATIHVMSHVVHYGSNVFEGIRCYNTAKGPAIFRLKEHILRLYRSAKVYRMEIPFEIEDLVQACVDLVRKNQYNEAYIRPFAFRGYGVLGIDPTNCPVDVVIGLWPWGKYLGNEALEKGVDVCVSSWQKFRPNTIPAMAKAGGQYLNSQLVKLEAQSNGFVEGILLDAQGYVSEGSGENIFVILDGRAYTTPLASAILPGITRECAMTLLDELEIEVIDQPLPREMLYIADEVFFTGTAVEITPIRSIDKIQIAHGKPGEITKAVQKRFFEVVKGNVEDKYNWLHFVNQ
ncbi:MAG: branched-chain amino acid transaminase [bacterium]